jgi:glycosyltransferase involved in cell wall biosynthesis
MTLCTLRRVDSRSMICNRCARLVIAPEGGPAIAMRCRATKPVAPQSGATPDYWPKDAAGLLIPQSELTPADMPCAKRGEAVRENVPCDLCGEQGTTYTVYTCAKHGECSVIPRTKGNKLRDCLHCPTRREPATPKLYSLPVVSQAVAKRTGPIRVGLLTPDLGAGGAERWIASLAKYLPRDRAIISAVGVVLDGQKWDTIAREITATGTPVFGTRRVKWGIHPTDASTVTFVESDEEATRRTVESADVVVSWGIAEPGRLLNAANWHGPHIVVSHGSSAWARNQLRTAAAAATHSVAVSSDAASAFPEDVKSTVIWNGSELERLAPTRPAVEVRESWGCTPKDLLVGFVGRLSPEKHPLAVAHLAAALQRRMPSRRVRPVWVGTGLEQIVPNLKADARSIAGEGCVWVPPPPHIGDAWQALDLHVMASPEEGFSLVVTEGLLAGVPTVATRVGIVPDLLARWGTLVVPVDTNPTGKQLADAAELALSDQHRPNVRRARQIVWEEFTAARMGARWADFLREVTS